MDTASLLSFSNAIADAVDAAAPSVVQVHGRRRPASGIVYAADLVLTTARALGRDDGLRVRAGDGRDLAAELAGWDPATSLALLRVPELAGTPLVPATIPARVGHFAIAIGRSWSNAVTATSGLVAVIGGPLPTGPGRAIDRVIRTTAPAHGGFAGGAFLDVSGKLIGVMTASEIRGLGVVIPTDIAWAAAKTLAEHGTLKRGYLGLAGQSVRLPARQGGGDDRTHALLVVGVSADSPAERAGLLVGDVILAIDGRSIQSPVDLLEHLQRIAVGASATLSVVRGGAAQDIAVVVAERPRTH